MVQVSCSGKLLSCSCRILSLGSLAGGVSENNLSFRYRFGLIHSWQKRCCAHHAMLSSFARSLIFCVSSIILMDFFWLFMYRSLCRFIASEDVLNLEAFAFLPEQPFSGAALSPQLCPDDDES